MWGELSISLAQSAKVVVTVVVHLVFPLSLDTLKALYPCNDMLTNEVVFLVDLSRCGGSRQQEHSW